jgi:hypothetical protein
MNRLVVIGLSTCLLLSAAIFMASGPVASDPGHDEPSKRIVMAEFPDPAGDLTSEPAGEMGPLNLLGGLSRGRLLPA